MRRSVRSRVLLLTLLVGCATLTGCGSGDETASAGTRGPDTGAASASPSAPPRGTASPVPRETATPGPRASPSRSPKPRGFTAKIHKIHRRSQVKHSWQPGCPVPLSGLRMITMSYRGFDHERHVGRLVVNADVAHDAVRVFHKLWKTHYPIRRMRPVDTYHGSDYKSIDADNTSAFNCRRATGSGSWSEHAYGRAIDLNPCENPYVPAGGSVSHPHCRKYADRARHDRGLIHPGDPVVRAFASIGWGWGGGWSGTRDYQHFSRSGR